MQRRINTRSRNTQQLVPVVLTAVYAQGTILKGHQGVPAAADRISGRNIPGVDLLPAVLSRETLRHALNVLIGWGVRK